MKNTVHQYLWIAAVATVVAAAAPSAFAQDRSGMSRDLQLEFKRIDQRLTRLMDIHERVLGDIRQLQRDMRDVQKRQDLVDKKSTMATDDVTRMRNTDIANLTATDQQIVQKLNNMEKHIEEKTPVWNWGDKTRDCEDIGTHQQIQSVRSGDGKFTLRYLCYDGKAIHLGTELNQPPQ